MINSIEEILIDDKYTAEQKVEALNQYELAFRKTFDYQSWCTNYCNTKEGIKGYFINDYKAMKRYALSQVKI